MSEPSLREILRTSRFLEGVPKEDLDRLEAVAQLKRYHAGAVVFSEGEKLNAIFLVAEGSVGLDLRVPSQGVRRFQTVGPGELLGWSPVLSQTPMTATARAVTPTLLVRLDAGQVLALCHHDPRFGFMFMRQTALSLMNRLTATRLHLLDVYRNELPTVQEQQGGGAP